MKNRYQIHGVRVASVPDAVDIMADFYSRGENHPTVTDLCTRKPVLGLAGAMAHTLIERGRAEASEISETTVWPVVAFAGDDGHVHIGCPAHGVVRSVDTPRGLG